jgi:hypothetical protein
MATKLAVRRSSIHVDASVSEATLAQIEDVSILQPKTFGGAEVEELGNLRAVKKHLVVHHKVARLRVLLLVVDNHLNLFRGFVADLALHGH